MVTFFTLFQSLYIFYDADDCRDNNDDDYESNNELFSMLTPINSFSLPNDAEKQVSLLFPLYRSETRGKQLKQLVQSLGHLQRLKQNLNAKSLTSDVYS